MDKNVDKKANVSLGQNERLVRCRHESLKKAVLEEPMVTHGDKLKNRWE